MDWILVLVSYSWVALFGSQTLTDIFDAILIFTALFMAFKKNDVKVFFTNFKPAWLWPLWLGIILVGLLLNADLKISGTWRNFLEFRWILTFLSWIYIFQNAKDHKKIVQTLALLTVIMNMGSLIVWLDDTEERAGGLLWSVMAFAHNLAPVLCFYFIFLVTNWKKFITQEKILYTAVVITSLFLVISTFTRGVWVGSVVALLFTAFLWNRKVFAAVMGGLIIVFLIGITTSERFSNRVFTKTNNETRSNQERTALWRGNWEMIKEYPIFGVGLGMNKSHLRKYYDVFGYPENQRQSHAHNQYLQYWAGTGTLGFLCYLIFLFVILKYSFNGFKNSKDQYQSHLQLALLAALICFLVGSLTESNFNIAKNRFLFLLLAGMAVAWSNTNARSTD